MGRARSRLWSRAELRLLAAVLLAALIPVVAVGATLEGRFVHQQRVQTVRTAASEAELLTGAVIGPRLMDTNLDQSSAAAVQARLSQVLDVAAVRQVAERVLLWDTHGRVDASDDADLVGRSFALEPDLTTALQGTVVAHSTGHEADDADDADERGLGKAVEVYVPIRAGGRVVGVFEIYVSYAPLAAAVAHDRTALRRDIAVALAALVLLLTAILWPVLLRLRRHAIEAARKSVTDPLTGLDNRLGLERAVQEGIDGGEPFHLVAADIRGLADVNEALGHDSGDAVIRRVGDLLGEVRGVSRVARVAGGEFVVLMPAGDPLRTLHQLQAATDRTYDIAGVPLTLMLSIGATSFPADGRTVRDLMTRATAARQLARRRPSGIAVYDVALDPFDAANLRLLTELRHGIAAGELVLHYQPQIAVSGGHVVGYEALVRWHHPERGLLSPGEFLPLAEKTGLVADITRWVLRATAEQAVAWRALGSTAVISVNISARDIAEPSFAAEAPRLVAECGATPAWICLELTETALVDDRTAAQETLVALREAGFSLSLDDFGQGYTSLGQLRRLPLHELKLDQAFVRGMQDNAADRAIVSSVADLAHNLGISVVAEGVETAEQLAAVTRAGYDVAQGWHLGRPGTADLVTAALHAGALVP